MTEGEPIGSPLTDAECKAHQALEIKRQKYIDAAANVINSRSKLNIDTIGFWDDLLAARGVQHITGDTPQYRIRPRADGGYEIVPLITPPTPT